MEQVKATLEWHYYCPKCERSCLTRFSGNYDSWINVCSDCGTTYQICPTPRALDLRGESPLQALSTPELNLLAEVIKLPPTNQ